MEARLAAPIYLLGFIPVLVLAGMMLWRRSHGLLGFSWLRFWVWTVGFSFCVLALSRPQIGRTSTDTKNVQTDLVLALDISRSMLVTDVVPSRLEFSISFVKSLLGLLPGVRVTVFPFALDGYVLVPSTDDIDGAMDMVTSLHPNYVLNQGTDLTTALETLHVYLAKDRQRSLERNEPPRKPQVVLISDGETHKELREEVLAAFRTSQIPVFTVGVGTSEGGRVPVERRLSSELEPLRDGGGNLVTSRMKPKSLQAVASATLGDYFPGVFSQAQRLAKRLDQARQLGQTQTSFKVDRELFPHFLLAAFVLFMMELLGARWEFAIRGALVFLTLSGSAFATVDPEAALEAETHMETRAAKTFNLGVAQMQAQQFAKAANLFRDAAEISKDQNLIKKAWFNAGNALLRQGEAQGALESYQRSYDVSAKDKAFEKDTNKKVSENMALATRVLEQMKSQPQEGQGNESESGENKDQKPNDPKGPQKFKSQNFSDAQKKKIFELVSAEEQQTLQRIQDGKNRRSGQQSSEKPW